MPPVRPTMLVVTDDDLPDRPPVPTPVRVSMSRVGATATKSPPALVGTDVVGATPAVLGGATVVAGASDVVGAVVDATDATVVAAADDGPPSSRNATIATTAATMVTHTSAATTLVERRRRCGEGGTGAARLVASAMGPDPRRARKNRCSTVKGRRGAARALLPAPPGAARALALPYPDAP